MKYQKIDLNHQYLSPLKNIPDPPKKLYIRGNLPNSESRPKTVAIVGSRRNTRYGETVATELATELARKGVIVVSGLAYGIDAIAHRACLDAGGTTIAVLGTNIEKIYPVAHRALGHRILEKGAILSEYSQDEIIPPKASFLIRNRLVSGLADAVVIIEAAERSGTLATATHALNQGKELFAVPGDITRPISVGCNHLIEQGAHVYTKANDVLNYLFPNITNQEKRLPFGDSLEENKIIQILAESVTDGEEIIKRLKMPVHEFNQIITLLELKGIVRSQGFNHWILLC